MTSHSSTVRQALTLTLILVIAFAITSTSAYRSASPSTSKKSSTPSATSSPSASASASASAAAPPATGAASSSTNDLGCPLPSHYYSRAAITRLLYPESVAIRTRDATLYVYVNIDSNPGAPNFVLVANISGLNVVKYNRTLGTLQGFFYVKFGDTYDLNAIYTYNIQSDNKLVSYNSFCLNFPPESNVPQFYRGDVTADNLITGTYTETKSSQAAGGLPAGNAARFEYFWDIDDQVINCLTDFDTTGAARVNLMTCIYYTPTVNAAVAAAYAADADASNRRRRRSSDVYLQVGALSRVNELLIDPQYRHYFPVVQV